MDDQAQGSVGGQKQAQEAFRDAVGAPKGLGDSTKCDFEWVHVGFRVYGPQKAGFQDHLSARTVSDARQAHVKRVG